MYQIGDFIVYGSSGVCRVEAIGTPEFSHVDRSKLYYTLTPVYTTETIYAPVDTPTFMRPVMTSQEAEELIAQIPAIREDAADAASLQMKHEHYQESLCSHDCTQLIHLIKTIYAKNSRAQRAGRKPSTVDQQYRKRAEDLLHGELAVVLGIPRERVPDYIRNRIS